MGFVTTRFPGRLASEKETCDISTASATDSMKSRDEDLLSRIESGETGVVGVLFRRYERVVRGISRRILRDNSEADDLVQDLFLCVQRKCALFDRSKGSAASWIIHMAYQKALERRRYLASRHFYTREEVQGNGNEPVGNTTSEEDYSPEAVFGRNGLTKLLVALSEDQRETLRLYFFEGYTFAEISEKLGQPLGNVRHHYYRALDKLRKQMFQRKVRTIRTP
jgi:RNA polymerase sigma-70 factor, ECF subfamily